MTKKMINVFPVDPVENHRDREKGVLVYPVYSRRSEGLSVGINLFPDRKICSFDCPYCEVFPFSTNAEFSAEQMEEDLRAVISSEQEQVKDICFSGSGEPTMSKYFPEALERAARVRQDMAKEAELVLITNGSFVLNGQLFSLLVEAAAASPAFNIWLKLDAGTPEWYKKMSRSGLPFEKMICKIKEFTAKAPVTIQTMICAVDGAGPPPEEAGAWEKLVTEIVESAAANGNAVRKVQIYGKARPSPEDPKAAALPVRHLEKRAVSLRSKITSPEVKVYP